MVWCKFLTDSLLADSSGFRVISVRSPFYFGRRHSQCVKRQAVMYMAFLPVIAGRMRLALRKTGIRPAKCKLIVYKSGGVKQEI